jgi:hypothetical protein
MAKSYKHPAPPVYATVGRWVHYQASDGRTYCRREVAGSHDNADNGHACRVCHFGAKKEALA